MKNKLLGGWFCASAIMVVCLSGNICHAQTQLAAPGTAVALPPDIAPGGPLAEVVKLVQVGVDASVIKTYIANSANAFNLDSDKIISLSDLGVPADIVNAMMDHDKNFSGATTVVAPQPSAPAPNVVEDDSATAAPTTVVDENYFNDTLSPYGTWVEVEGYGRVWRPTTVIYDANWQPYCDRGHWVYSDCGWYWDSDYSWGVTFHYGRWFHHDRFGWCWWPDTTWAPSWVTWRQSDAYCGWAPLPPFAVYRPGVGFFYRGVSVAVGFDFGLPATCFTFVPPGNFCDRRLRSFRAEPQHAQEIFRGTTVINNFNTDHRNVINRGISVDRINASTHRNLVPVDVGAIRNAEHQGWRGPVTAADRAARNAPVQQFSHGSALRDDRNNGVNVNRSQNFNQPNQLPNRNENINSTVHPQSPESTVNRNFNPPANNHPVLNAPVIHNSPPAQNIQPNRSFENPAISKPAQNSSPQMEQRQVNVPTAPERVPQRDQNIEQHQNAPASEPHAVIPQSQAPVQNQPRNANQNSDKDKQDR